MTPYICRGSSELLLVIDFVNTIVQAVDASGQPGHIGNSSIEYEDLDSRCPINDGGPACAATAAYASPATYPSTAVMSTAS